MRWKVACIVAVLLLVGSNLFWIYNMVDLGVTYSYQQDALDGYKSNAETLARITQALAPNLSRDEFLALTHRLYADADILDKDGAIWVAGVGFVFDGDRLRKINAAPWVE
ncbi:hypothetical protein FRZ44_35410 [Hypericibacter terrae]|uniref:Uncharacterized protein n=1 Tax=Hypericibacter terrae TaxID=2602015 RepID=A0A5J6MTM2_9PROT|nr:hypothetical protein [Hypericibacter terrae]QEX18236.1 hypothetical protein FRZ44_35410 [Hypericibacter terrae]